MHKYQYEIIIFTWLIVLAEHEHSMVPADAKASVVAENSPGARLYPAIVVRTTKPIKAKMIASND